MSGDRMNRLQALMDKVDAHRVNGASVNIQDDLVDSALSIYEQQGIDVDRSMVERASQEPLPHAFDPIEYNTPSPQANKMVFGGLGGLGAGLFLAMVLDSFFPGQGVFWAAASFALSIPVVLMGLWKGISYSAQLPDPEVVESKNRMRMMGLLQAATLDQIDDLLCHPDLDDDVEQMARTELLRRKRLLIKKPVLGGV